VALLQSICIPDVNLTVPLLARMSLHTAQDCERRLEPTLAAGLLVRDDRQRLSFAHGVVREVLYDELEPELRCGTHIALWSALAEAVDESNPRISGLLRAGARHVAAARDCLIQAQREVEARDIPALLWRTSSSLGSRGLVHGCVSEPARAMGHWSE
jgi:hypothetical protein